MYTVQWQMIIKKTPVNKIYIEDSAEKNIYFFKI